MTGHFTGNYDKLQNKTTFAIVHYDTRINIFGSGLKFGKQQNFRMADVSNLKINQRYSNVERPNLRVTEIGNKN